MSTPTMNPRTVHVYYGPYSKIWGAVQQSYKLNPAIKPADRANAQWLYRNSTLTIMYQIDTKPEIRMVLFQSLIDYMASSKSTTGLESIFLTLMFAQRNNLAEFISGIRTFHEVSSKALVPGNGPMLFYNVETKQLLRLSNNQIKSVLGGHIIDDPQHIPQNLEPGALWICDPFKNQSFKVHLPSLIFPPKIHTAPSNTPQPASGTHPAHLESKVQTGSGHPDTALQHEKDMHNSDGTLVAAILTVVGLLFGGEILIVCGLGAASIGLALAVTNWAKNHGLLVHTYVPEQPLPDPDNSPDEADDNGEGDEGAANDDANNDGPIASNEPSRQSGEQGQGEETGDDAGCFPYDTLVLMSDGSFKAIGEIVLGDTVLAQTASGQEKTCRVTTLHTCHAPETFALKLSDSVLITTPGQRFSIHQNGNFAAAKALKSGVRLNATGREMTTVDVIRTGLPGCEVFNLTVENAHTYFVGEESVLAHNKKISGDDEEHGEDHEHGAGGNV